MIKPIVEGHGEVDALPVLLRRISGECFGVWDVQILTPGRYKSGRMIRREGERWVPGDDLAKAGGHAQNEGALAVLVVMDLDDDCPKEVHGDIRPHLEAATGLQPSRIVFAKCEYEAWFLASAETLGEDVPPYPGDPEAIRGAKGALEDHLRMRFPYVERTDQPRFSARIDLNRVYERCRSFRKLVKDFRELLEMTGSSPAEWPITVQETEDSSQPTC